MQAFVSQNQFVQVGFMSYDLPGGDLVHVSGRVAFDVPLPSYALPPAAQLFAAIDRVGPGHMIAWLGSRGPGGRYSVSFARSSVPAEATAYFWNGSSLDSLASADGRRPYFTRVPWTSTASRVMV
jgi:hypothetical protein